jgi:hypothetical protein
MFMKAGVFGFASSSSLLEKSDLVWKDTVLTVSEYMLN